MTEYNLTPADDNWQDRNSTSASDGAIFEYDR